MALARRCNSMILKSPAGIDSEDGFGLRIMKYTRSFGRKRILISNFDDFLFPIDDAPFNTKKRLCNPEPNLKSPIESLPQDILIRILCGVDHTDLKQLFNVSTVIREAAVVAEKIHFAYSTPKKTSVFRCPVDLSEDSDEIETPNAPKQQRNYKSRLNGKKLAGISVQLFA